MRYEPIEIRFWKHVEKTPTCWLWTGYKTTGYNQGYGMVLIGRSARRAHRVAYELLKGPIPPGLTIDHLCRVRHCVNPDHMEVTTSGVNTLRGFAASAIHARKTACPKGHSYDRITSDGERQCSQCKSLYSKEYQLKNKEYLSQRRKVTGAQYYRENRDRILARQKTQRNSEYYREYRKRKKALAPFAEEKIDE